MFVFLLAFVLIGRGRACTGIRHVLGLRQSSMMYVASVTGRECAFAHFAEQSYIYGSA